MFQARWRSWVQSLALARWELAAYAAIILVALVLRLWDLGARAQHHDESLHSYYSYLFAQGHGFQHNPLMHGPFQFEAIAAFFKLFGASDFPSRIPAALFGTGLVAAPFLLRGYLGRTGAIVTAVMLAFSPSILYYSRFARGDMYALFFDLVLAFAMFRYIEVRRPWYLALAAAVIAFGVATIEGFFFTIFLYAIFLLAVSAPSLYQWVRRRIPRSQVSPAAIMLAVIGTLTLPQAASLLGLFQKSLGLTLVNDAEGWGIGPVGAPISKGPGIFSGFLEAISGGRILPQGFMTSPNVGEIAFGRMTIQALDVATGFTILLIIVSTAIGLWWGGKKWAVAALVFWALYITMFTTIFTNPAGIGSGLWQSLGYWIAQHDVARGGQPWFYYFMLLPVYEFLPLLFGLGAWVWGLWRGHRLGRIQQLFVYFLVYWGIGTIFMYSWAGEKMPWLVIHLTLPFVIAAGMGLGRMIDAMFQARREGADVLRARRWQVAGVALSLVLLLFTVRAAFTASFVSVDVPRDMLIYTHTSPAIPDLYDRLIDVGNQTGQGKAIPILLDTADAFGWPWYWYLRDFTSVNYVDLSTATVNTEGRVLLIEQGHQGAIRDLDPAVYGPPEPFPFRQWFPEEYKNVTAGDMVKGVFSPSWWKMALGFWLNRDMPHSIGSIDAVAYFPKPPQPAPQP